ncbi:MAG: hydroxyacid dehydrogenase [Burkholderiales bacterium]|nr:hydroxyacid dehydrogenase [Opitutaceae bacterium]
MNLPKALFHFDIFWKDQLFPASERASLRNHLDIPDVVCGRGELTRLPAERLAEIEVLVAGWDATKLSHDVLDRMPRLRAVFYAAGDTRGLVAEGGCFERGITLVSANRELARSVAEHTLGFVLLSLKNVLRQSAAAKRDKTLLRRPGPGIHGSSVVGLVGYGEIARSLRGLLRPFSVRVLVYDPYLAPAEAASEGVEQVALETLFSSADVVSCHLPLTEETKEMLRGPHFRLMRTGATFINTARGGVVQEDEMLEVLAEREDLWAVLDVLKEEPPPATHPGFFLPNVTLTPHIAGCLGPELIRLGHFIVEEVARWRTGKTLLGEVRSLGGRASTLSGMRTVRATLPLPEVFSESQVLAK